MVSITWPVCMTQLRDFSTLFPVQKSPGFLAIPGQAVQRNVWYEEVYGRPGFVRWSP